MQVVAQARETAVGGGGEDLVVSCVALEQHLALEDLREPCGGGA